MLLKRTKFIVSILLIVVILILLNEQIKLTKNRNLKSMQTFNNIYAVDVTQNTSKVQPIAKREEVELSDNNENNNPLKFVQHKHIETENKNSNELKHELQESEKLFVKRMQARQIERKAILEKACKELGLNDDFDSPLLHEGAILSKKYKLAFCSIPKSGSTNMKQLVLAWNGIHDLSGVDIHKIANQYSMLEDNRSPSNATWRDFTKLIIVRDPFDRLVSSYKDKVDNPSGELFQKRSQEIKRLYSKDSNKYENRKYPLFEEFVDFLTDGKRKIKKDGIDNHWNSYNSLCHPCIIKYDVIAHLETSEEDMKYLFKLIDAPSDLRLHGRYSKSATLSYSKIRVEYMKKLTHLQKESLYDAYMLDFKLFGYDSIL